MKLINRIFFIGVIFSSIHSFAQGSNLRQKKIVACGVVTVDSLFVIENSFRVVDVDSGSWAFDYATRQMHWKSKCSDDSVVIRYRVFDPGMSISYRAASYDSVLNKMRAIKPEIKKSKAIFYADNNSITYTGSFARSVSVGNTQSASFNSDLNLQLSGYIADSIEISANLSDNNLQLQPDGSTQQLNEFDRISLQFKKKGRVVQLGDIDLNADRLRYLKFSKRVQGVSFQQKNNKGNDIRIAAALAKGKFTRNSFMGIEGNQGPYRLSTPNRELFFIVSAGTEKVFFNGNELVRGEENDYIINYNTAEIFFTSKRMITKDSRIQIEFEYADQNYLNTLLYAEQAQKISSKLFLTWGLYSSVDSKNSSLGTELSAEEKGFLHEIDSDKEQTIYKNVSISDVKLSKTGYIKVDTVYNGVHDSVYVYSQEANKLKHSLSFVELGMGKGNYVLTTGTANERIYEWTTPVNGIPQGNYEPGQFLVAPKKQQVITTSVQYVIDSSFIIGTDFAVSDYNSNSFNNKTSQNGYAGKMSISKEVVISKSRDVGLSMNGSYERINERFKSAERIFDAEFERQWGLPFSAESMTQTLSSVGFQINKGVNHKLAYQFKNYSRGGMYAGSQHTLQHRSAYKNWEVSDGFSYTKFTSSNGHGVYVKMNAEVKKQIEMLGKSFVGIAYESEKTVNKNSADNSIRGESFSNETYSAFISSDMQKKNQWNMRFSQRVSMHAYNGKLIPADQSLNYDIGASLLNNRNHQLKFNLIYRDLKIINTQITSNRSDKNLLGRMVYSMQSLKGFIKYDLFYEIGSAQEQKRNVSYAEVPAGRGTHTWLDRNNDGIQQLNEFEIAQFTDHATFLRLHTPTNEFVKANFTQLHTSLTINPSSLIQSENRITTILKKALFQSSLQIQKKDLNETISFNSFRKSANDSSLIQLNYSLNNKFYFNRADTKWGFDISNHRVRSKSLLNYGVESRSAETWCLNLRVNPSPTYLFEYVQKFSSAELYLNAPGNYNYFIKSAEYEPRVTYNYLSSLRWRLGYQRIRKSNEIAYGGETATFNNVYSDVKWNVYQHTSFDARFSYENILYSGQQSSSVSYIMLNGLLPGNNLLWNIDMNKRIFKSMELSLQYEGRKPASGRTVNIGRLAVRAIL